MLDHVNPIAYHADTLRRLAEAGIVHNERVMAAPELPYTALQGQYLAFIYYYTKIHRRPPAEANLQDYFGASPPLVHAMMNTLERKGFIERTPRTPRSTRLLLPRRQLPDLE